MLSLHANISILPVDNQSRLHPSDKRSRKHVLHLPEVCERSHVCKAEIWPLGKRVRSLQEPAESLKAVQGIHND